MKTESRARLVNSEICQKCGKCCKEFTTCENLSYAQRFLWLDSNRIEAKDTPFQFDNGDNMKKVTFRFPCKQLEKRRDGKYYCKVWGEKRPDFCETYPDHVFYSCETWNLEKIRKLIEFEANNCPAMKNISVDDVVNMLKEHRGVSEKNGK
jgi:Fe-S-cluster containining protein